MDRAFHLRGLLTAALFFLLVATVPQALYAQNCGCMDVVLVVDDTGSMGPAIANVQAGLGSIIVAADVASGSDARFALISFSDTVQVDLDFTANSAAITTAVNALVADGGLGEPEASDQALSYAVDRTNACTLTGSLSAYRPECLKIAVLVTDAVPGGCNDTFEPGDVTSAQNVANAASVANVLISAIHINDGVGFATEQPIMMSYASTTGGVYLEVPSDGTGTGAGLEAIIADCGSETNECPNSHGYWKNHLDAWPVDTLTIGGEVYTKEQLVVLLSLPTKGDQSLILARQLIATLLNIANGSDPDPIQDALDAAELLLTGVGRLPLGVKGSEYTYLAGLFDRYNNRYLTPDCTDSRVGN